MRLADFSIPKDSKVDIIIRAKNGHEMTDACIDSIISNTTDDLYRIILVDDGSDKPQDFSGVDFYIRSETANGAVTATNLGLSLSLIRSDSQYALILDNDTRIPQGDENWLERFIAELEEGGPQVAAIGATTNFANPPQQILSSPATYTHDWEGEGRSGVKNNPAVPWFVSFAVLLRKDVVRRIGFWDERYNPGNWEDTDYSVQLRTAGYELRVARSVYIHHDGHQTFKADLQRLLQENGQKFTQKWGAGRLFDLGMISADQMKTALGVKESATP